MSGRPAAPLSVIPPDLRALADYERRAKDHLSSDAWQWLQEGAGDGLTLAENRAAFDRIRLLPRVLTDLRGGSTALELLGQRHAAPILLAPVAYLQVAHPEGELAMIRAATAMGIGSVLSTLSSISLEAVAAARQAAADALDMPAAPLWFQLYPQTDRADTLALVRRAEAAGYQAIMVTVDAAIKHSGSTLPAGIEAANLRGMKRSAQTARTQGRILLGTTLAEAAPRWDDIRWLRAQTRLPLIVKGIMAPQDARLALEHGADALVISNHGGRVLDGMPSPLAVLPAILEACEGRMPLLLDSGVRRGTDVLKALAMGATAVMVGRPQLHALAVAGMAGLAHVLLILRTELEHAMAQTGCANLADIGSDRLFCS